MRRLVRAGVLDDLSGREEVPGLEPAADWAAVDRDLGIGGRSLSTFPKRFPVSAPASPQVEAIRAAAARIRELR